MTIALDLNPLVAWTDDRFIELCRANPGWNFELTAKAETDLQPLVREMQNKPLRATADKADSL